MNHWDRCQKSTHKDKCKCTKTNAKYRKTFKYMHQGPRYKYKLRVVAGGGIEGEGVQIHGRLLPTRALTAGVNISTHLIQIQIQKQIQIHGRLLPTRALTAGVNISTHLPTNYPHWESIPTKKTEAGILYLKTWGQTQMMRKILYFPIHPSSRQCSVRPFSQH